jgi:hypothetical protein
MPLAPIDSRDTGLARADRADEDLAVSTFDTESLVEDLPMISHSMIGVQPPGR